MPTFQPSFLLPRLATLTGARSAWLAFSGGMDSTVLLHALVAVRDQLPFQLRALHVDHGLHPDSRTWARTCARTCERLSVPFETRRLDLVPVRGESLEAIARQARYQTMAGFLEPGDLLLTAHHRDDQAETLLLALMRGSGPAGLAAMPPRAPLGSGILVRPLLAHSRAELSDYARSRDLHWLEDPANRDLDFDRNFLRQRVLPLLAERWPSCAAVVARSAAHCAEAQEIVDRFAADRLVAVSGGLSGTLSITGLRDLDLPACKLVLRHWIRESGYPPPDSRHLGRIVSEVLPARADADPLVAWPGCQVRRYRDELFVMDPLPPVPAPDPIAWWRGMLRLPAGVGCLELLDEGGYPLDPRALFEDGLEVRFGARGLSCRPNRGGHRRSLKNLFQEAGVPPWVRPYIPLVFEKDVLIAVSDILICCLDDWPENRTIRIRWDSELRVRLPLGLLGD